MLRLSPFLFFIACGEDEKVTAIYNAPLIVMDRPAQIYEYSEITLTGVISYQNDISELSVNWTFDGVAVCPDAGINAREEGGLTSCTISIGETGSYSVGVVVSDGVGSGSDSHEFDALANPLAVSIESPTLGDVLNEGENVLFSSAITDDSNDSLQVQWTSDHPDQGEIVLNSSEVTPAEGSEFVYNDLPVGAQLLKVRVSDNSNSNAINSMQIEVNDCPTAPEVSIDPASSSENLRARIART